MSKKVHKKLYTGFIFGEGRRDKIFLQTLIDLKKFQYHTSEWHFNYGNAHGECVEVILEKCHKESSNLNYDIILCFIDLDGLKNTHSSDWEKHKKYLETKYSDISIVWQINNAEEEYVKVLGNMKGKTRINNEAKKQIKLFINSDFWKKILKPIKLKEKKLNENKK